MEQKLLEYHLKTKKESYKLFTYQIRIALVSFDKDRQTVAHNILRVHRARRILGALKVLLLLMVLVQQLLLLLVLLLECLLLLSLWLWLGLEKLIVVKFLYDLGLSTSGKLAHLVAGWKRRRKSTLRPSVRPVLQAHGRLLLVVVGNALGVVSEPVQNLALVMHGRKVVMV